MGLHPESHIQVLITHLPPLQFLKHISMIFKQRHYFIYLSFPHALCSSTLSLLPCCNSKATLLPPKLCIIQFMNCPLSHTHLFTVDISSFFFFYFLFAARMFFFTIYTVCSIFFMCLMNHPSTDSFSVIEEKAA